MTPPHPRIAVICAQNGRNAGMVSVDQAAIDYFGGHECAFSMFMATRTPAPGAYGATTFHEYTHQDQLRDYTHIVFWGDFLNNPVYGRRDFATRHMTVGRSKTRDAGTTEWRRLMLLDGFDASGKVIISAGGNFQHDFFGNDRTMADDIDLMMERFSAILPRDPFSLKNLSRFLPFEQLNHLTQGMDCAFLLSPVHRPPQPKGFVHAFGRSDLSDPDAIVAAVAQASAQTPTALNRWLRLPPDRASDSFAALRAKIAAARFVVTDIYHLAVNALNMGVPTLLIARDVDRQTGTLGDFKKITLMQQLGLDDWLIIAPSGQDDALPKVVTDRLAALDRDPLASVAPLRAQFRRDLDRAIFGSNASRPIAQGPAPS
ncbi:MAG: hypothetical protein DI498_04255 [Paracoccus denitrificans]|nr:MAG: hypothetical protein DI498_04255 [Paracoccus denitrificans]PZO85155.1 MAG: hypothetical protein DI633_04255 [Paracoccus denitrificans]